MLIRTLFEDPPAPPNSLPAGLTELYGGGLELPSQVTFANVVSSLDGVATFGTRPAKHFLISRSSSADHFLMGLLRALADCILIDSATLNSQPKHPWTPESIYPAAASRYAELNRPLPLLVVVTGSGKIDPSHPALREKHLILTGPSGKQRLLGSGLKVKELGEPPFSGKAVLKAIGEGRILVEAGPTLLARLLDEQLIDQLFLAMSPVIAGRKPSDGRKSWCEGVQLLPRLNEPAKLLSVRSSQSHLFLQYQLGSSNHV